jgi:anti-sigma-K factor RskA
VNIQEYISSGIVESYVLGLVSDQERNEFEQLCAQYPELMQAKTAFELALEKKAMENALSPSPDLKERIFREINTGGKSLPMHTAPVRKMNWFKLAAAACLVLLAGSLYWNISLYNRNKSLRADYDNTVARLNDMEKDVQVLQQNPSVKMASMKGLDVSPQSYATVYWDTSSHDVYLMTNNLPVPANDKQYQLWAIFNGKPVDLGVFDIKKERLLIQARNTQGAEAFAITMEKKGGSPSPEGTMYVMGKL